MRSNFSASPSGFARSTSFLLAGVASALASLTVLAGDAAADDDPSLAPGAELSIAGGRSVAALSTFAFPPNIAAAVASRLSPNAIVRGIYGTVSGFQIYRCELSAAGQPAWALRTPLAELLGAGISSRNSYHARSDFGGLVSDAEQTALGLLVNGVRATAPIWQFTVTSSGTARRETVAGRVIAQDSVDATAIPYLFLEVRGRAVSTITGGVVRQTTSVADPIANPIASSEYLLRLNTRAGLAPSAGCSTSTLGAESQQPYRSVYYFIDNNPPSASRP
jgi:Protein of unknown function (DUF3455)